MTTITKKSEVRPNVEIIKDTEKPDRIGVLHTDQYSCVAWLSQKHLLRQIKDAEESLKFYQELYWETLSENP